MARGAGARDRGAACTLGRARREAAVLVSDIQSDECSGWVQDHAGIQDCVREQAIVRGWVGEEAVVHGLVQEQADIQDWVREQAAVHDSVREHAGFQVSIVEVRLRAQRRLQGLVQSSAPQVVGDPGPAGAGARHTAGDIWKSKQHREIHEPVGWKKRSSRSRQERCQNGDARNKVDEHQGRRREERHTRFMPSRNVKISFECEQETSRRAKQHA